ncbi:DUF5018 domain-containing protein [Pontimicrobium sp. MEBiC06410]
MKFKTLILLFVSLIFINCSKDDDSQEAKLSSENKVISFTIKPNDINYAGVINEQNKTIEIETVGLEVNSNIVPQIVFSAKATISPDPTSIQDFSQPVIYTVTAENGDEAVYTVTTNNTEIAVPSNEKKILSFQLSNNGNTFDGVINHDALTIDIEVYGDTAQLLVPTITVSENATFSPGVDDAQNYLEDVEYTVTAEDGTFNIYTVRTKVLLITTVNSVSSTSDFSTAYYSNAKPYVRTQNVDLTLPNSKIILANATNSYELSYSNYSFTTFEDDIFTNFQIEFPNNIVTASDYTLKYVVDDVIKTETIELIDVLAENVPVITSSNQSSYNFGDTLILTGTNLVPGIRIAAHNGSIYAYNESSSSPVSVNSEGTMLTFQMNVNSGMFPSGTYQTPIFINYNGRYGDSITVEFD